MAAIDGVMTKVTELEATVAAHKLADAAAIKSLQDQIDLLTTQLAAGVTDEQIQQVIDSLTAIQNSL